VSLSLIYLTLSLIDSSRRILFGNGIELSADKCRFHCVVILGNEYTKATQYKNTLFFIHTDFNLPIHRAFWHLYKTVKAMLYNKSNCEKRHN
jgi:hypothetical protein